MQEKVREFCRQHNLSSSSNARLLDLVSEVGELAKEFLKASSYGQNDVVVKNKDIVLELGDIIFSLLCLANSLDINIQESLDLVLLKYEKRICEKNNPSSSMPKALTI